MAVKRERAGKRKAAPRKAAPRKSAPRRWSARVMAKSDALDLDRGVFKRKSPLAIARSLKRSAERSTRRKSPPFRSAMSMLTFYINRGGKNLDAPTRRTLGQAKDELRRLFGRGTAPRQTQRKRRA